MTPQSTFDWFSYDLAGPNPGVGIYKSGPMTGLTKVVLLDAHDSGILAGIQEKLLNLNGAEYSVSMQHVLGAFYEASPASAGLRPAED